MTVPEGWERPFLKDISSRITDGSHFSPTPITSGLPIVTVANMLADGIDLTSCARISEEDFRQLERNGCRPQDGDVLFSKDGTVGRVLAKSSFPQIVLLSSIALISPDNDRLDGQYLGQYLRSPATLKTLRSMQTGTAIKRVVLRDIRKLPISLPPLPEQKKIASILSSVDETIQATRETIEQTKKVKQGLMQELLTRGIGHTRFKKTEIGEIPEEWTLTTLGSISDIRRGASPRPIKDPKWFSDRGYGWVRIEDVTRQYKFLRETKQYLSDEGVGKSVPVHNGDVIMSICATIGMPSIVNMDACIHDGFVLFGKLSQKLLTDYLFYYLLRRKESFSGKGQPGTQKNINTSIVKQTELLLPPLEEQKRIANILSGIDRRIDSEELNLQQLQLLKKGLMQDLLTGKVRVAV